MPKFENLTEAFWYIGEHPTEYLPEKSLALFEPFWWGYERRYRLAFPDEETFDLLDGFHDYVSIKYSGATSSRGAAGFVRIYSRNEAEAYERWFSDFKEFLSKTGLNLKELEFLEESKIWWKKHREFRLEASESWPIDFFSFLKMILKRSQMYVGSEQVFSGIVSLISGWLRVPEDFGFAKSEQEAIVEELQGYISRKAFWLREFRDFEQLNWKNVLLAQYQTEERALEAFASYVDEYAFQGKRSVAEVEYRWGLES